MLEGIHFCYDGIYSVDMGVINCKIGGGMFEETFLPTRNIHEKKIAGRDKPYFQRLELEPLSFDLTFAFEYYYDERKIREVARWLMQPYYKPFFTVDNPNRIFYCMVEGDSRLIHNGLKQGYITLTMRCDGPYSYTPKAIKDGIRFGATKFTKTITENTYSSEKGSLDNIVIVNGNLTVNPPQKTWAAFAGMKWGDLI